MQIDSLSTGLLYYDGGLLMFVLSKIETLVSSAGLGWIQG